MHNVLIKKALLVKQMLGYVFACLLLSTIGLTSVNANPVDTFEFNDEVTKVRFQVLSKELRCPKCQNQNLADSNSKIAVDLRKNL